MAADSLRKLAAVFLDAGPALMEALASCTDIPDQHTPELFFQTVKAASDVCDHCTDHYCGAFVMAGGLELHLFAG